VGAPPKARAATYQDLERVPPHLVGEILVHESVRDCLLAAGFTELEFYKPENVAL
jgi:hypothetical protein